jgi:hypothetical protein
MGCEASRTRGEDLPAALGRLYATPRTRQAATVRFIFAPIQFECKKMLSSRKIAFLVQNEEIVSLRIFFFAVMGES